MYYSSNIPKHKVFLSFHHQDDFYRQQFEQQFSNGFDPVFLIVLFKMEILIQIIKLMLSVERFVKTIFLTLQ